jgi:hypothetical protein
VAHHRLARCTLSGAPALRADTEAHVVDAGRENRFGSDLTPGHGRRMRDEITAGVREEDSVWQRCGSTTLASSRKFADLLPYKGRLFREPFGHCKPGVLVVREGPGFEFRRRLSWEQPATRPVRQRSRRRWSCRHICLAQKSGQFRKLRLRQTAH